MLTGDITLAIADIDLVRISLRALISSVEADRDGATDTGSATVTGEPRERRPGCASASPRSRTPSNATWPGWC